MSNPAILMLAYYFPPRGGSGVQRSQKFAKYLPEFGFDPVVITTCRENITQEIDESLLEEIPGVPVYRVPSHEPLLKSLARWHLGPLVSLTLRPDGHILWKRELLEVASEVIAKHHCKAIYVSVQPWSAALIGLELKRRHKLPLIVDFRDPWTMSTSKAWPTRWHHARDRRCEERVFRAADRIITVTPGIVEAFRERYPWAKEKIELIYNGYDAADFPAAENHSEGDGPLTIGFTGRLYSCEKPSPQGFASWLRRKVEYRNCETDFSTHSLRNLLQALAGLVRKDPTAREAIRLQLAGTIHSDNLELAAQLGVSDMIVNHGVLPHSEAIEMLRACDVSFLPMMAESDGRRSFNLSGKIFEYLALRKPILAAVPEGDAADLVRRSRCGWVVGTDDGVQLEEILGRLLREKPELGPSVQPDPRVIGQFDRRKLTGLLAGILNRVLRDDAVQQN